MSACLLLTTGLTLFAEPPLLTVQLPAINRANFVTEPGPLAVSPDGRLVAAVTGSLLCVWEHAAARPPIQIQMVEAYELVRIGFTADSRSVVCTSNKDTAVRWYDPRTGRQFRELAHTTALHPALSLPKWFYPAYGLASGAEWLLTAEVQPGAPLIGVVDLATGRRQGGFPGHWYSHWRPVSTRDGKLIMANRNSWELDVWDVAAGKRLRTLPEVEPVGRGMRQVLGVSADGKQMAVFEGTTGSPRGFDYWYAVWGLDDGRLRCCLRRDGYATSADFSADGRLLALGVGGGYVLIDLVTETARPVLGETNAIAHRTASPDGRLLAVLGCNIGQGGPPDRLTVTRFPDWSPPLPATGVLTAEQFVEWWAALGSANEFRRRYAVRALASRPVQALAEIATRVKPDTTRRQAIVVDLLAVLNDDKQSESWHKAQAELRPLARRFEPFVVAATVLSATASRPHHWLTTMLVPRLPSEPDDFLTDLSAVAILEAINTNEAISLLASLAGGADGSRLTNEAKTAIGRLKKAGR